MVTICHGLGLHSFYAPGCVFSLDSYIIADQALSQSLQLQFFRLPGTLDVEASEICRRLGRALFHAVYASGPGTLFEFGRQGSKLLFAAAGQNFYSTIGSIAHPASEVQRFGFPLYKPAEAHSLHPAANHITLCDQVASHFSYG